MAALSEKLKADSVPAAYCVSANTGKDIMRQLQNNGGVVLNHSNTHIDMTKLSTEQIELELGAAIDALEDGNIKNHNIFFPPYGSYTQEILDICYNKDILPVLFDVDMSQWAEEKGASIAKQVLKRCKNGSIVFVDIDKISQDKVIYVINEIKKKKWEIISLENLLYRDNYSIDKNGVQNTK